MIKRYSWKFLTKDEQPYCPYDFMTPLIEGLNGQKPFITIPTFPVYLLLYFLEILYYITGLPPFLTRNELVKVLFNIIFNNY